MYGNIKSNILFMMTAAVVLTAVSANAGVIVAENFGGNGSGGLAETAADMFSQGITAAGGSATWVANSGFLDNGSVSVNKKAAYLNLGSYINDTKGTSDGLFTLTMTISQTTGSWISVGFAQENTPSTDRDFTGGTVVSPAPTLTTNGLGTIIYRAQTASPAGELNMYGGPGSGNAVDGPDGNTGSRTLTVTLDLTPAGGYNGTTNFGKVTWSDSALGVLGSYTYTTARNFGSILITGSATTAGTISSLKLFQASEAETGVIVAENFGGNGSGGLAGTGADTFSPGITAAGGSATWAANSGFKDNGSVSVNKKAAYLNLGSYINNAKGTANGLFELTMTISETTGSWISVGFGQENTPSTDRDFTGGTVVSPTPTLTTNGMGTIFYRAQTASPAGELDMVGGPGSGNAIDGPDDNTGSRTLTVTLDLTPAGGYNGTTNFGKVTWSDSVLGVLGSYTYTTARNFGSILITGSATTAGTISSLTLTQIGAVLTFNNVITTQELLPAFLSASVANNTDPITGVIFTLLTDDTEFPPGAAATLTNTTINNQNPTATLTTNMPGTYKVRLEVSDGTITLDKIAKVVVYADSCEAQKNVPGGWVADYFDTNKDCIVNLVDFAEMAGEWLNETAMTSQEAYDGDVIYNPVP
jgi:hypothetical protein